MANQEYSLVTSYNLLKIFVILLGYDEGCNCLNRVAIYSQQPSFIRHFNRYQQRKNCLTKQDTITHKYGLITHKVRSIRSKRGIR